MMTLCGGIWNIFLRRHFLQVPAQKLRISAREWVMRFAKPKLRSRKASASFEGTCSVRVGRDTWYGILRSLHHRRHNRCGVVVRSFRLGADCAVILERRVVDCPQYHLSETCASVAVCCFGCYRHPGPGADEARVPCAGWRVKRHSKGMMGSRKTGHIPANADSFG